MHLVDGSSDNLISDLASSAIDVALWWRIIPDGMTSRYRCGANES